jgi:hypothetical protein
LTWADLTAGTSEESSYPEPPQWLPEVVASEDGYALKHFAYAEYLTNAPGNAGAAGDSLLELSRKQVAALLEPGQQAISVSRYVLEHHAAELERCAAPLEEISALASPHWLRAWSTWPDAASGFVSDVERVFARAAECLARAPSASDQSTAAVTLARCVMLKSSIWQLVQSGEAEIAAAVEESTEDPTPVDFAAALPPVGEPTLDLARRIADFDAQAYALLELARTDVYSHRTTLFDWALAAARQEPSGHALAVVSRELDPVPRLEATVEAASRLTAACTPEACWALCSLAALLPGPEAVKALQSAFAMALSDGTSTDTLVKLAECANALPAPLVAVMWNLCESLPAEQAALVLPRLAGQVPEDARGAAVARAFRLLIWDCRDSSLSSVDAGFALCWLAPQLPAVLVNECVAAAEEAGPIWSNATIALAKRRAELADAEGALALARTLIDDRPRLEAIVALLPLLAPANRAEVWQEFLSLTATTPVASQVIAERLRPLLDELGASTVLELARSTGSDWLTLVHLAQLAPEMRAALTQELLERTRDDALTSSDSLFTLAPLADAMAPTEAVQLYLRLCDRLLATNSRAELLWTWTRDDLARLGPLIRRIGGEAAVLGVAEQIMTVAAWIP